MFQLWDEKILRATSVNFLPKVWDYRPGTGPEDPDDGRPGMHVHQWELLEWGPVGIPDNPYAVGKVLDRGRLDGRAIAEPILRMLKRFAPERRAWTPGIDMAGTIAKSAEEQAKELADAEEKRKAAEAAQTKTADAGGKGDEKPAGKPEEKPAPTDAAPGEGEDEEEVVPQGSKSLAKLHKGLCRIAKDCHKSAMRNEHPEVKSHLKAHGDTLLGLAEETRGCHGKSYKDMPELKMDEGDEGGGGDDGGAMAKHLSTGTKRHQLKGLGFKLRLMSGAKNLDAAQKQLLDEVGESIEKMCDDARVAAATAAAAPAAGSGTPAVTKSADDQRIAAALTDVLNTFKDVNHSLKEAQPASRATA